MAISIYAADAKVVRFNGDSGDYSYSSFNSTVLSAESLKHIFGLPYQFTKIVDPRGKTANNSESKFGAKYAEKIISRMPLLFLVPCTQKFMGGMSNGSKGTVLSALLGRDADANTINGALEESGRYYTTIIDREAYYGHVNTLCHQLAFLLGIQDYKIPGFGDATLGKMNWNLADSLKDIFATSSSAVVFFLDSYDSVSESFSNTSMESSLASQLNGYSNQLAEMKFLLGDGDIAKDMAEAAGVVTSIKDGITSLVGGAENLGNVLNDLSEQGINTILYGGKLEFPKLWEDSQYDRSYSFDIKLRTPDNDDISIYLNILVPYIHLLAFALPQGVITDKGLDPNGYESPLLCRAYCKGMLSVDMGMVSSLSVTKGASCQWNDSGLPSQMDISLNIEDLYAKLHLNPKGFEGTFYILSNTALMDFLSNMAGLNIVEDEVGRRLKIAQALAGNVLSMAEHHVFNRVADYAANFRWWLYESL